jgi:ABC-type uncharacterized transport system permease subunit
VPPLFPATVALYGVACALFFAHLFAPPTGSPVGQPEQRRDPTLGISRAARFALALAFASHAIDIGWLCTKGMHPVVNAKEAISFAAWLTCGAYLAVSWKSKIPALGVVLVPVTLILDLAARLGPAPEARGSASPLAIVHITLASAGTALFAVAAGGAILYLLEERSLKAHRAGRLWRKGPALETLDTLNRRCISIGFALFTIALVTGAAWLVQMPGGHGLWSPQYLVASAAWLLYAGLIGARLVIGLRGRRAAVITVFGAVTAIGVLVIYFVRDVLGA